ncbi:MULTISPECIES: DUF4386 family protein [Pseudoalteromonas]|uniref:DUF4386 domain-containing protein n=1 Tax=Pseudoalteromonas amylolytica TaxID=1859457 RepID=A0A1S1MR10_9GAMM|nr:MULTISPECIES: DUF4386 family protein [Pseudoalteromonas]OHU85688.1 hypothetical protein BFC16_17345 [Pseudoalteromonas sp. JW3]OHU87409.1 hypothetical protein BET10_21035 [Pseudoalteromonas amylolytica]
MQTVSVKKSLTRTQSARIIAIMMLLQMVLGLLLNFYFLKPILVYNGEPPISDLTSILGGATLVALMISTMNLAFGLLIPKESINQHSSLFITIVVFATVGIAMCAYEYAQLSEYVIYLSTINEPNNDISAKTSALIRTILASGRNEAHFLSIFISSFSLLIFYLLLLRNQLLPVRLCWFALLSVILQLFAVAHTFFEAAIPDIIQLPLAITQIIVPFYLLIWGFKKPLLETFSNNKTVP